MKLVVRVLLIVSVVCSLNPSFSKAMDQGEEGGTDRGKTPLPTQSLPPVFESDEVVLGRVKLRIHDPSHSGNRLDFPFVEEWFPSEEERDTSLRRIPGLFLKAVTPFLQSDIEELVMNLKSIPPKMVDKLLGEFPLRTVKKLCLLNPDWDNRLYLNAANLKKEVFPNLEELKLVGCRLERDLSPFSLKFLILNNSFVSSLREVPLEILKVDGRDSGIGSKEDAGAALGEITSILGNKKLQVFAIGEEVLCDTTNPMPYLQAISFLLEGGDLPRNPNLKRFVFRSSHEFSSPRFTKDRAGTLAEMIQTSYPNLEELRLSVALGSKDVLSQALEKLPETVTTVFLNEEKVR